MYFLEVAAEPPQSFALVCAAILPRNGALEVEEALHIPLSRSGESEREREGGGGCLKPLRGQAPVTPNSLILRSLHLATRYKSGEFVERDPCEMPNLPESQIFKA